MATSTPSFPLLDLPQELRYEIYDYLCIYEPKSYPFGTPPISSINQRPPPVNLHLTCRRVSREVQQYFFSKATLRFVAIGLNFPRESIPAIAITALRCATRIEVRLCWFVAQEHLEREWPYKMHGWLAQMIDLVLDEARCLKILIVSVSDTTGDMEWKLKERLLAPLEKLSGRVDCTTGEVLADDAEKEEVVKTRLAAYLSRVNCPIGKVQETIDHGAFEGTKRAFGAAHPR
jgi:hypothetical protein